MSLGDAIAGGNHCTAFAAFDKMKGVTVVYHVRLRGSRRLNAIACVLWVIGRCRLRRGAAASSGLDTFGLEGIGVLAVFCDDGILEAE